MTAFEHVTALLVRVRFGADASAGACCFHRCAHGAGEASPRATGIRAGALDPRLDRRRSRPQRGRPARSIINYPKLLTDAYRGDKDKAFEWLQRARQLRDSGLMNIGRGLLLVNLYNDARWNVFLRTMGLADAAPTLSAANRSGDRLSQFDLSAPMF